MTFARLHATRSSCVQRETAESATAAEKSLAIFQDDANMNGKAGWSSKRPGFNTLYRYPSLPRPVCTANRPTTLLRVLRAFSRAPTLAIGYHANADNVLAQAGATVALAQTTKIGKEQCKRFRSFLRQWQYSVWQGALTMMSSVALPVQARGLSPLNCWAPTGPARWLSVQPQASSATTRAFAADLRLFAPAGVQHAKAVAGGYSPAAAFCFGGTR